MKIYEGLFLKHNYFEIGKLICICAGSLAGGLCQQCPIPRHFQERFTSYEPLALSRGLHTISDWHYYVQQEVGLPKKSDQWTNTRS